MLVSVVAPVVFVIVSGRWVVMGVEGMTRAVRGHLWFELALSVAVAAFGVVFLVLLVGAVHRTERGNQRGERWVLDALRGRAVWTRWPLIGAPTSGEIASAEVAAVVVQRRKWPRREEPCDTVWIRLKSGEHVGVDGGRADETIESLIVDLAGTFGCEDERVEEAAAK